MSTRQNLYSVGAALNRVEYFGDDMSSESEDDDHCTPAMTSESDVTDSSDSAAEESEGPSVVITCLFDYVLI